MRKLILFLGLVMQVVSMRASLDDNVRVSLLTCAPGTEIYALFGHTAIRYENLALNQDWVFNYGLFSFDSPHFVYRFVKGETDYQLGAVPFQRFEMEYTMRGSSVYQQVLNLTAEEKESLVKLLNNNLLPANRIYRYNYFYDNCTTRARDKIEECLNGEIVYSGYDRSKTFRDIIHEFTVGNAWSELGIDLCLGSKADAPIDGRQQMFAPFYMMAFADKAFIHRTDTVVPLVKEKFEVIKTRVEKKEAHFLSPMFCALLVMFFSVGMAIWSIRCAKSFWFWDFLLFGLQGLGGCIVAFLFFFSTHPTVDSNWMIVLFNPLPLLCLPMVVYNDLKRKKDYFHWFNTVCLTFFIVIIPFIPQEINLTVLPLALGLLACSASHLIIYYRKAR